MHRVTVDVVQHNQVLTIHTEAMELRYSVEGASLPSDSDVSFSVWGLLPWAMENGFDLHFDQAIDPVVISNAERLSQIWEMWLPGRYRSIGITSAEAWKRPLRQRLPQLQLFSGGINSVFSILNRTSDGPVQVATVNGIDRINDVNFKTLIAKTQPMLDALGGERIIISTDAKRDPSELTHGMTLASCLFLLSDVFEHGSMAADWSHAAEFVVHPWGSNHVTNALFVGSDFSMRTTGADVGRTEKISAIVSAGFDLRALTFCRNKKTVPENCGKCRKCIRTKAMFLIVTGGIPNVFLDDAFDESLIRKLIDLRNERVELFDLYYYAKRHGLLNRLPSLSEIIDELREHEERS